MPTAGEYEAMAARFDGRADALDALPLRFVAVLGPEVLVGPLVHAVDQTFQVSAQHLVAAARTSRDVAATCRRRAEGCRAYTRAVDRHRQLLRDPNTDPATLTPPTRLPWMEYGA